MASSSNLPPVDQIPSLSTEERAAILDLLFEPSTQLHTLSVPLLHDQKFPSYAELIAAVGVQLTDLSESASTSDTTWLQIILGSHPRLGAKKVESAQSQAEQAQLQGSGEEAEQLRLLNEEYEKTFPGLRYVVFVNGRPRSVIMEDMKQRIASNDLKAEQAAAIRVSITQLTLNSAKLIWCRQCVRLPQTEHQSYSSNGCQPLSPFHAAQVQHVSHKSKFLPRIHSMVQGS